MINKIKKGFTLIETLVAVFILATAIAGPLTIASRGLTTALVAKDQVTAFYLAQDAVEYIRFARDTNTLAGGDWMTGLNGAALVGISLSPCSSTPVGCYLDSTGASPAAPTACSFPAGCINATTFTSSRFLCYNQTTNRFMHTAATGCTGGGATVVKTPFARSIIITPISGTEVKLTVTVAWSDTGNTTPRSVVVTENLFNWQ